MNGQEAFRRLAQQLQRANSGGGPRIPGGGKGLFAGSGLIVALVGGGLLLNASLFNGVLQDPRSFDHLHSTSITQLTVDTEQSSILGEQRVV